MFPQNIRILPGTKISAVFLPLASSRGICTSSVDYGKRNFRHIFLANKRGTKDYKQRRHLDRTYAADIPVYTNTRPPGYYYANKHFRLIPEMIPELVVPDLSDCSLKPYVSYRAADTVQREFTAQELFTYVYQDKIEKDFKSNKLDADGNPLEPSREELLDPSEAYTLARRTGSDIFSERIPRRWECLERDEMFTLSDNKPAPKSNSET